MKYELSFNFDTGKPEIKRIASLNPVQIVFKGPRTVNLIK